MTSHCIINHWLIDIVSGSLIHQLNGEKRRLGEYQLKLLVVLVQNAGKILTREELNTLVWERRVIGNNSLPNAIHALRVALEDDGKQQRIIKTIPKKGYILEPAFCQFHRDPPPKEDNVSPEEVTPPAPLAPDAHAAPGTTTTVAEDELRPVLHDTTQDEWEEDSEKENALLIKTREKKHNRLWRWIALVQGSVLIALLCFLSLSAPASQAHKLIEEEAGVYSNIRLYELLLHPDREESTKDINNMFYPTLYALNLILKEQGVEMKIFYHASGAALNYTMTFSSRCDQRQLVMNVAQWRINKSQLNALIYRETERKINEMAKCVD